MERICRQLEVTPKEEHFQDMSIIDRRETRQVIYFMACGLCGCIHRLEFNSIEEENNWFKRRAS